MRHPFIHAIAASVSLLAVTACVAQDSAPASAPASAPSADHQTFTIATWNVENWCDEYDNPYIERDQDQNKSATAMDAIEAGLREADARHRRFSGDRGQRHASRLCRGAHGGHGLLQLRQLQPTTAGTRTLPS